MDMIIYILHLALSVVLARIKRIDSYLAALVFKI